MKPESILFAAIQKTTPAERAAYLDGACGTDVQLRQQIDALLRAHESGSGFMEKPAAEQTEAFTSNESTTGFTHQTLDQIGPYKLREKLGEGGMGTVYVADQKEPVQRRVAIKLIKTGSDSKSLLARFEQERQALALMDHPNIAKVFDAGVFFPSPTRGEGPGVRGSSETTGIPYFVMELIKGVPITKYCDEARLSPKQRLELFIPVCQAVQHAHQKGIIHRDLKPSNILIGLYDGKPIPKIIDFGVAKATGSRLTDESIYTEVGSLVGTLEYMSPEQAELNNLDIDTRSDIYALGVILYELLTGSVPFSRKDLAAAGFGEMLRVIKEVEPTKPSTKLSGSGTLPNIAASRHTEPAKLSAIVRGELDWIVMKCLEKDRGRRYETANQLGMEIQRYLSDEPVLAGPPSAGYRFSKFLKRNKGKVLAASLILLALLVGITGTSWGLILATQEAIAKEQARAEEAAQRQIAVANQQRAEVGEKLARDRLLQVEAEKKKTEEEKRIALAIRDFLQNKLLGQADAWKQGNTILKMGGSSEAIKENPTIRDLLDRAAKELTVRKIENNFPNQPLVQAAILQTVGDSYVGIGEAERAIGFLDRSLALRKQHLGIDHPDTIESMSILGEAYRNTRKLPEAIDLFEKIRELKESRADDPRMNITQYNLAMVYQSAGRNPEAIKLLEKIRDKEAINPGFDHQDDYSVLAALASSYQIAGRLPEAIGLYEKVLDAIVKKFGPEHPESIITMGNLATAYNTAKKLDLALPLSEKSLKLAKEKFGPEHPNTIRGMGSLAQVYQASSQLNLALPLFEEGLRLAKKKLGTTHPDTLNFMSDLAGAYRANRQLDLALPLFEQTLKLKEEKLSRDHPDTLITMGDLAVAYQAAKKMDLAIPLFEQTLKLQEIKLGRDHPQTLMSMNNLAAAYWMEKQLDKSIPLFEATLKRHEAKFGRDNSDTLRCVANLGVNYKDAGRFAEAVPLLEEAYQAVEKYPGLRMFGTELLDVYVQAGQSEKALALSKDLVAEARSTLPKASIKLTGKLSTIARSLLQAKAFGESELLLRECLAIREKLQPDQWSTFSAQSLLGMALLGKKEYADAEPMLRKGYEGLKARENKIPQSFMVDLTSTIDQIIELYTETNKPNEVAKWKKELDTLKAAQKEAKP